jgi:hypothetical protein
MITQISLDYPKKLRSIITIPFKEIDWTEEDIYILVISRQKYWSNGEHKELRWNKYPKKN